jgi:hypothetical protein
VNARRMANGEKKLADSTGENGLEFVLYFLEVE